MIKPQEAEKIKDKFFRVFNENPKEEKNKKGELICLKAVVHRPITAGELSSFSHGLKNEFEIKRSGSGVVIKIEKK